MLNERLNGKEFFFYKTGSILREFYAKGEHASDSVFGKLIRKKTHFYNTESFNMISPEEINNIKGECVENEIDESEADEYDFSNVWNCSDSNDIKEMLGPHSLM